ncbi:MAG TPA: VOC family protein [Chthoniobacterales bacterium]|nr:VOC family protein [Chthoniobacterales bacterium]
MSADTLCWTDIPVTNLGRAIKFYSAVLDREVRKISDGKAEYGLLPHDEGNASGCLCIRSDSGGIDNRPSANGPLVYLLVEGRLKEAVEAARKNGGKILRERQQIGEHGFRAVIIDSEGNRIALHTSAASP